MMRALRVGMMNGGWTVVLGGLLSVGVVASAADEPAPVGTKAPGASGAVVPAQTPSVSSGLSIAVEGGSVTLTEDGTPALAKLESGGTVTLASPGKYWLGLGCVAVPEDVRAPLNLPEQVGLQVTQVLENGPAQKAGIQRYDLLLGSRFGTDEQPLKGVDEIAGLVQKAEGQPITFRVLRGGKTRDVTITPAERPAGLRLEMVPHPVADTVLGFNGVDDPHRKLLWEVLEQLRKAPADKQANGASEIRLNLSGPIGIPQGGVPGAGRTHIAFAEQSGPAGIVMIATGTNLPEGVSVAYTKQGTEPGQLTITQGEQKWTAKETELDRLPAEAQAAARSILKRTQSAHAKKAELEIEQKLQSDRARVAAEVERNKARAAAEMEAAARKQAALEQSRKPEATAEKGRIDKSAAVKAGREPAERATVEAALDRIVAIQKDLEARQKAQQEHFEREQLRLKEQFKRLQESIEALKSPK